MIRYFGLLDHLGEDDQITLLIGHVQDGLRHFSRRMTDYPRVFAEVAGRPLRPGTINVRVDRPIQIQADFRISGKDIGEPEQDLLLEKCRINGEPALRIRPSRIDNPEVGGHGDSVLEIACYEEIPNISPEAEVKVELFRVVD